MEMTEHARLKAELRKRTPDQWREMILAINPEPVRLRVAAIVWWTYLSHRRAGSPWTHLDDMAFVPSGHNHDAAAIKAAMIGIGFPESYAEDKSTMPKIYLTPLQAKAKEHQQKEQEANGLL